MHNQNINELQIGSRRGGLFGAIRSPRLMPTPPCGNLNTQGFGSPIRFISVNSVKWTFWRGYNCIKYHPWGHFSENLREGLSDSLRSNNFFKFLSRVIEGMVAPLRFPSITLFLSLKTTFFQNLWYMSRNRVNNRVNNRVLDLFCPAWNPIGARGSTKITRTPSGRQNIHE